MSNRSKVRVRGVLGGPFKKMLGQDIPVSRETLHELGSLLVKHVVKEAARDLNKQGWRPTPRGQPEGLPASQRFLKSFSYRIVGNSTIEILSTWPFVKQATEGRAPYKMTWLTQVQGVHRVPFLQSDGTVVIRTAPFYKNEAWIHPGFARHTFLNRAVRKAREEMARIIVARYFEENT